MSTNWGAAQYGLARDTLGTGVQDRGIQKFYYHGATYSPSTLWDAQNLPSTTTGVNLTLPWFDEKSPYFFRTTADPDRPRFIVPAKKDQMIKLRLKTRGWFGTALNPEGVDAYGSFSLAVRPNGLVDGLQSPTQEGRVWYPVMVLGASASLGGRYYQAFSYEHTYFFKMKLPLVETTGVTSANDIHRLTETQKINSSFGITTLMGTTAPTTDDAKLYIQHLESEISIFQNFSEFSVNNFVEQ